jgi:hypothetical protein
MSLTLRTPWSRRHRRSKSIHVIRATCHRLNTRGHHPVRCLWSSAARFRPRRSGRCPRCPQGTRCRRRRLNLSMANFNGSFPNSGNPELTNASRHPPERPEGSCESSTSEQELQRELKLPRIEIRNGRGNCAETATIRRNISRQQAGLTSF